MLSALVVEFPLRGEGWVAVNSPADRIPSHGTDLLGQRLAYDFLMADRRPSLHYHPASRLRSFLVGVPTRKCYAWGSLVHSPFDGEIVRAVDGFPERSWIRPPREAVVVLKNALTLVPERLPAVLGNHVIARSGDPFDAVALPGCRQSVR